jgi:sodium pump decarboxylase gamma subunit
MFAFLVQTQPAVIDSLSKAKIQQNAQRFDQIDPWGIGMTFIGMAVVFLSLLLLYILFYNVTKLLNLKIKKALTKAGKDTAEVVKEVETSGEVYAAIAMALHLHSSEIHDHENVVLTINRVARTYSPWSSKIYGLRQYPR